MYAYGSRVPSVDTDVLLAQKDAEVVIAAARASGVTVGAGEQLEPMPLDEPSLILGPDPELGERDRGYVPRDVLRNRTMRQWLDLGSHGHPFATVPTPGVLAFMKLKAYHNRELQWRAHRDPTIMARIPVADRGQVMGKTVDYFYRKAGKDLYDIAYLLSHHDAGGQAREIARETGLDGDLLPLLRHAPPDPLLVFAIGMANAEFDAATAQTLDKWGR